MSSQPRATARWINGTVIGILLATFFSDVSHEMCTSVLTDYLADLIGLGLGALGFVVGISDLLVSLSKLAGGYVGQRVEHKRRLTAAGYVVTAVGTAGMGLVHSTGMLALLRTVAWMGRGFRGPLRDFMLADSVAPTHYGRAFGLERAGDMLGAVVGPLTAIILVRLGVSLQTVILWTLAPGLAAAAAFFCLTRERSDSSTKATPTIETAPPAVESQKLPKTFWIFLVGVTLFGLGDFSRIFIVHLVAQALGQGTSPVVGTLSIPILVYTLHNLVSAIVAYPIGHFSDRRPKLSILLSGYVIGVVANVLLALWSRSIAWLMVALVLSAIYVAIEETVEKAAAAELLPRHSRARGFGLLATGNALGDMASTFYVGALLQFGSPAMAFSLAATFGLLSVAWLSLAPMMSRAQGR